MNCLQKFMAVLLIFSTMLWSCNTENETDNTTNNTSNIVYQSVNKEFVVIRDVAALRQSDDEISNHIDSILNGELEASLISTGVKKFDLDNDLLNDIGFEIINLNDFNVNALPESFDSLAARVNPLSVEILDNSTFGYADALDVDEEISVNGIWTQQDCVLGTFMNAGQFQGYGDKYLGFRFINNGNYKYGWVKINCSQHNDTLQIIDYAYNNIVNSNILAGQME